MMKTEDLKLTEEWDKVFPESSRVDHEKELFVNRYGVTLAADVYKPKGAEGKKLPAIAMAGPFGAVKEQVSGRYAQKLAENGFLTLAFDPSFTGESGGEPRNLASPDINTEDFSAAVDYLSCREDVDPEKIGILGVCGFGGMALNAAANDPRIKATVTSTMYDMSREFANGDFDQADSKEARNQLRKELNAQRTKDYRNGYYQRTPAAPVEITEDMPSYLKDYYDFYRTKRGYHPRSVASTEGWNTTSTLPFLNMPLLTYIPEIENAVMIIHGEKAHSRYFSTDSFKRLEENSLSDYAHHNKSLVIVPGAVHCDLYDNEKVIPFDTITKFYHEYLGETEEAPEA